MDVFGTWNANGTAFDYEVVVTNKSSSSVTFNDLKLNLVRSKNYNDLFGENEQAASYTLVSSVTVESNGSRKYTGQRSYVRSDDYFYGLFVSSTTPAMSTEVMPFEEAMPDEFNLATYILE